MRNLSIPSSALFYFAQNNFSNNNDYLNIIGEDPFKEDDERPYGMNNLKKEHRSHLFDQLALDNSVVGAAQIRSRKQSQVKQGVKEQRRSS